ncbi:retinal guanylyl cyclase 2 isoform X1 [Corythoichthys intestinalis]|uniref:retinal guanylyl cyclase 2 isoform X1 n=2 Tax=Corythoichthys intestinalis TaxID=161448 RepID=UPI0025A51C11|nr:retinal guanylyl cyclase 2 isoform X1 [Corythoichthys intestinalis]XP_057710985.1 retinal guanylyl cyclase 2 isoform X1 [Corythoichthys intestinalis]XP_057710986.1 retinal guanylyl cyclase 2 isoform X1 [Corythoichthys intestinalis]
MSFNVCPRLFLVLFAFLCVLPVISWGASFRIGLVGPWECDPVFAKALPHVAAQLAIKHINRDPSLSYAATFDYIILNEPCKTSRALEKFVAFHTKASAFVGPANPGYCDAASMLSKSWNKALFAWGCIGSDLDRVWSHPTFARSMPRPTWVLSRIMRYFHWAHVGIISASDDIWVETANKVADSLRAHAFPVRLLWVMENTSHSIRRTLAKVRKMREIRVLILCMHSVLIGGELQKLLLETAYDMQMIDGSLVFVPYDALLYSLPYRNISYPALKSNSKLLRAYDAVLTVTIDSPQMSFFEAYENAIEKGEVARILKPQQVSPFFGTIYSSVILLAHAVQRVGLSKEWMSGGNIAQVRRHSFEGFSHPMKSDASGNVLLDYIILDTDGVSCELMPTHRLNMEADSVNFLGRDIHFPHGSGPGRDAPCWFTPGAICSGGVDLFSTVSIVLGAIGVCMLAIVFIYFVRRRVNQIRLVRGPNKILLTLEDVTFINPSLSKKPSLDDSRASAIKSVSDCSIMSPTSTRSPATYENSNVVILEGDWAWLKRLPYGSFSSINPKTSDLFELMKDMRHENVNPFLGFFLDCGVFAIVTEFCSRGSLEDLLLNDDVKLDWMFKSSLLLDLIKGMKYLHHCGVSHSHLKSRNCVVDGRFVLKITDFGYNEVLEAQRFPYAEPPADELLWTAPELLRSPQPGRRGTLPGDVYSFAIITQEVVIRGPPFCMLDLSAADVIEKLRKPPPLCRPLVSLDCAPFECIQLMKQCWNEQPEKRPTFEEIFDKFKDINKGKKTNIIDSMLRMLEQYSSNLEELIRERTEELEIEKQKTEKLLTQMLPPSVAEALKIGGTVVPEYFDSVSLYFSDIVGFTTISANSEPIEVVALLNSLYTLFDAIIGNHDVYKVETIGDAYMVASGVPVPNGNRHVAEIANMSLDILSAVGTFKMRHMPDVPVRIRIGLHTGPCVAGVVGLTMPRYCLFGDTVNTASRMESSGLPYRIHVHQNTVKVLRELNLGYKLELRGRTGVKGKGTEDTYWLVGRDGFTKPLPVPPELKSGVASKEPKDLKQMLYKAVRKLSHIRVVAQLGEDDNVMMSHH